MSTTSSTTTDTRSRPDWPDDPSHWMPRRAAAGESDVAAAFVILGHPQFARGVASSIGDGLDQGSVYFEEILDRGWSTSEQQLLMLAAHLWNSAAYPAVDLDFLIRCLDDSWLAVVLEAMTARHGRPLQSYEAFAADMRRAVAR